MDAVTEAVQSIMDTIGGVDGPDRDELLEIMAKEIAHMQYAARVARDLQEVLPVLLDGSGGSGDEAEEEEEVEQLLDRMRITDHRVIWDNTRRGKKEISGVETTVMFEPTGDGDMIECCCLSTLDFEDTAKDFEEESQLTWRVLGGGDDGGSEEGSDDEPEHLNVCTIYRTSDLLDMQVSVDQHQLTSLHRALGVSRTRMPPQRLLGLLQFALRNGSDDTSGYRWNFWPEDDDPVLMTELIESAQAAALASAGPPSPAGTKRKGVNGAVKTKRKIKKRVKSQSN